MTSRFKVNPPILGMTCQIVVDEPEALHRSSSTTPFSLTELKEGDRHFKEIIVDFENAGLHVINIKRLQNVMKLKAYMSQKEILHEQRVKFDPKFNINEKYLYHGTAAELEDICELGLDDKLAGDGCFGKGIYFSDNPRKCTKYANRRDGDKGLILCVRAILGDIKVYPKGTQDRKLLREPPKTGSFKGWRFYDSVQGRPTDYTEFVVYRAQKAIIEYLITYSKQKTSLPKSSVSILSTQPSVSYKPPVASPATVLKDSSSHDAGDDGFACWHLTSSDDDEDEEDPKDFKNGSDTDCTDTDSEIDLNSNDLPFNKKAKIEKAGDTKTSKCQRLSSEEERTLMFKRNQFSIMTGEFSEYVVETFLLHSNFDVNGAADLYFKKQKNDAQRKNQEDVKTEKENQEEEDCAEGNSEPFFIQGKTVPTVDSEEWKKMTADDKEAVVNVLEENFLLITSLTEAEAPLARKFLGITNYNLDQAVVTYYESL